jgi:hypothetical protein
MLWLHLWNNKSIHEDWLGEYFYLRVGLGNSFHHESDSQHIMTFSPWIHQWSGSSQMVLPYYVIQLQYVILLNPFSFSLIFCLKGVIVVSFRTTHSQLQTPHIQSTRINLQEEEEFRVLSCCCEWNEILLSIFDIDIHYLSKPKLTKY